MDLDVSVLKVEEIRDIITIKPGFYNILLSNGTRLEGKVSGPDIISIKAKLRHYRDSALEKLEAATQSELISASIDDFDNLSQNDSDEPDFNVLNLSGSILDIELINSNFQAFWCREDEVHYRINNMGYVHAKREDVLNMSCITNSSKIGDSVSTDGVIRINELILLKVHKKIVEKINEYYRSRQTVPEGLQEDHIQRGGMAVNYPGSRSQGIQTRREITNG